MDIKDGQVKSAAKKFIPGEPHIEKLKGGLINISYKVSYDDGRIIFLQCINNHIFSSPKDIVYNYKTIYNHLVQNTFSIMIPAMVKTIDGEDAWIDKENNFWRAIDFVTGSYTPAVVRKTADAYIAAKCFGSFTRSLSELDPSALKIIIPHFHDLDLRYQQFEEALEKGNRQRINKASSLINEIKQHHYLVDFYNDVLAADPFRKRIMHHDCKISNILFNKDNQEVICPIDLDTVMPGYYFSDLGDMIRTMACNMDENSREIDEIKLVPEYYNALVKGYMEEMGETFTESEKENIHLSGLIMIYMQAIRFLTDYFMKDVYYQVDYEEQNFMRAANQLKLLENLEQFLKLELLIDVPHD